MTKASEYHKQGFTYDGAIIKSYLMIKKLVKGV